MYLYNWKDNSIQEIKIILSHIAGVGTICVINLMGRVSLLGGKKKASKQLLCII